MPSPYIVELILKSPSDTFFASLHVRLGPPQLPQSAQGCAKEEDPKLVTGKGRAVPCIEGSSVECNILKMNPKFVQILFRGSQCSECGQPCSLGGKQLPHVLSSGLLRFSDCQMKQSFSWTPWARNFRTNSRSCLRSRKPVETFDLKAQSQQTRIGSTKKIKHLRRSMSGNVEVQGPRSPRKLKPHQTQYP